MNEIAVLVRVSGRVQGVSFRYYTREQALLEGLRGWVRNLVDGDVETWVQGERDAVERMRAWLHEGPPSARVTAIRIDDQTPDPALQSFEIRR